MTKISALSDIGTSVASNDTFVLVDVSDPTTPNKKIQQQNLLAAGGLLPDGSAGTPGLSFLSDTNVGLFRPTTDTLAIATGGSERLRIDSSGRLGLGTSSPSTLLTVQGDGTFRVSTGNVGVGLQTGSLNGSWYLNDADDSLRWYSSTGGDRLTIGSTGNVGIGTTAPNRKLEVSDATVDNFIRIGTTGAFKSGIEFANGGTAFGQLYFNNVSPYDFSLLQQYSTGSVIFGTNNTERARIDSSGRLLVGTSSSFASGDGVLQVSNSQVLSESATGVANNGTAALTFTTGGGAYHGFLSISVCSSANATVSTSATYSIFGRGTSSTITQIATANGAGGARSFTVTTPSGGIATVTNTAGSNSDIYISFFGGLGG
jgi:hypothetical protein